MRVVRVVSVGSNVDLYLSSPDKPLQVLVIRPDGSTEELAPQQKDSLWYASITPNSSGTWLVAWVFEEDTVYDSFVAVEGRNWLLVGDSVRLYSVCDIKPDVIVYTPSGETLTPAVGQQSKDLWYVDLYLSAAGEWRVVWNMAGVIDSHLVNVYSGAPRDEIISLLRQIRTIVLTKP